MLLRWWRCNVRLFVVPKAATPVKPAAARPVPNRNAGDLSGKIEDLTNQISEYKVSEFVIGQASFFQTNHNPKYSRVFWNY